MPDEERGTKREPDEPCFLTPEDDPSMLDAPAERPIGPDWWDGHWPSAGINSLADLDRWVNDRLEEMISLWRTHPKSLGNIALETGRQAVENATRFLARTGRGDHPPRPKPDQLRDFADIQNALEALVRYIKRERAAAESGTATVPSQLSTPAVAEPVNPVAAGTDEPVLDSETFVIDFTTFSVRWRGRECPLRNTKPFHVLVKLAQRPGHYATIKALIDAVWPNDDPETNTVQKTVGNLRQKLAAAGMVKVIEDKKKEEVAIIEGERDTYRLLLPAGTRVQIVRDIA